VSTRDRSIPGEEPAQQVGRRERVLSTMLSSMDDFAYIFDRDGRLLFANRPLLTLWGKTLEETVGRSFHEMGYPPELARTLDDQIREVVATRRRVVDETLFTGADGSPGRYEYVFSPAFAPDGSVDFVVGSARDVSARKATEDALQASAAEFRNLAEALQQQRAEHRALFDLVPAMIWFKDTENRILRVNQRVADAAGLSIDEIEGRPSAEIYPRDAAGYYAADLEVIRSRTAKLGLVEVLRDPVAGDRWVQTDKVPCFDDDGKVIGIVVMSQDVTERKRAERELEASHSELREVSRRAGMSEVATNVLHNVGNVLNSVNVSASLMAEALDRPGAQRMSDVMALMQAHGADLGEYLAGDPKGRHIPAMLETLSREWSAQHETLAHELEALRNHIEHIKQIVAMQQGYAKVAGNSEILSITELVEQALTLKKGTLEENAVRVVRDFGEFPPVTIEKHRVLQILVNLIRNAEVACREQGGPGRLITVRTRIVGDRLSISVADNGSGIAAENLTRIFAHGFTTRRDGHGFGLHSGALAAAELGGSLAAASDGPGKGATFTLDLPLRPAKAAA